LLINKDQLKKDDLLVLSKSLGRRLGENLNSLYSTASVQLNLGDKIILYTDGVTELKNSNGKIWGERTLIKCLLNCHNNKKNISETVDQVSREISTFRQDHPLEDDVTYFMFSRTA